MATEHDEQVRRVWMDVSMLAGCSAQPTGITRVMLAILNEWRAGPIAGLRLCRLDRDAGGFVEVPATILDRFRPQPQRPPSNVPPPRPGRLALVKHRIKGALKPLKKLLPNPVKRLIKRKIKGNLHLAKDIARHLAKQLTSLLRRPAPPPAPLALGPGDLVVALGETWDRSDNGAFVWRLKREQGFRYVPMVYDLISVHFPQFYGPGFGERFTHWLVDTLWTADLVLAISECTRADVRKFCLKGGIPTPAVEVVRLGENLPQEGEARPPAALERSHDAPFVLCVGTVEARKNQLLLYHVWRRMLERDGPENVPALVVAGARGWMGQHLMYLAETDPLTRDHVRFLPRCTDVELRWLYRHCLFTAYPSFYEGWGLPVAESLAFGKYCVAGNRSSIPEAGGGLIGLHDPDSVEQCLARVDEALDPAFRASREAEIRSNYRRREWSDCARQAAQILAAAFGRGILKEGHDGAAEGHAAEHLPAAAARLGRTA